jgi:hypothetical protein
MTNADENGFALGRLATLPLGAWAGLRAGRGGTLPKTGRGMLGQTLKRKWMTSPSWTTYSLPSERMRPASLAPCSPLQATKSS